MPPADRASHLVVGTIGRAVGLRGEVEILVRSDDPRRFEPGSVVLVSGDLRPLTVAGRRVRSGRTVVAFREVGDRTAAEVLRGSDVVVPVATVRALPEGEYWDHDLIGCEVFTAAGEEVGRVEDVLHLPANEVLVVGRHLIPLVKAIVPRVDVAARRIEIEPIPGLLDED